MMTTSRGTTPTYQFTFDQSIDFGNADNVYITFSNTKYGEIKTFETADLTINGNILTLTLTQEETLALPETVLVQVNWTYTLGVQTRRCASNIVKIHPQINLLNEVIE